VDRKVVRTGLLFLFLTLLILAAGTYLAVKAVRHTAERAVQPVSSVADELATQVAQFLHPTPTVVPDPITIIHDVRTLARLETIQYSLEKVVTADTGREFLKVLFGDRLLLVAHGVVIAGVDLAKVSPDDLWVENSVLYMRLPDPEIFIATLDNEQSYIYDRQIGFLTRGDVELETAARRAAEKEIARAAREDGILKLARQNAESYLSRLLRSLGYPEVIFLGEGQE
jgi:hypothetical protein